MAQIAPVFDITSEFPPDAARLAELRQAAAGSRKEVDRRWALIGRSAQIGMIVGGTAAAGATWASIASRYPALTKVAVVDAAVWSSVSLLAAALGAYILIMGFGGFYVAAGKTCALGDESDLEELDYDRHPEKCVRFVKLCQASEVVRRYQNQLVAMERRPVVGEYEAAQRFAGAEANRRSQEAAAAFVRKACAQLDEAL